MDTPFYFNEATGRWTYTREGVTGAGETKQLAVAAWHCFQAADEALPWDDDDEDGRAEKCAQLSDALFNVCKVVA